VMKLRIRQSFACDRLSKYVIMTLLILTSTLTSQIPSAMFVRADEGDRGDDDLAMSTSSPSISDQYLVDRLNSATDGHCLQAPIQSVSSSEDEDENDDTMNVSDGDFETEWSAANLGSYLQLDLGDIKRICSVDASWSDGDEKLVNFVLSVSRDGMNFQDVLRSSSSGTTESMERYEFPPSDGRYLKITFYGDSENNEDVAVREFTVNIENPNEKSVTVPGTNVVDIPFVRDSQSLITRSNNDTSGSESSIHSAPTVSDIDVMVSPATSFEITLNGNDSDLTDHLTYYITSLPDHGNLTIGTTSTSVKYNPVQGYSGLDHFTYEAVDQYGLSSNNATVTMNINASNQDLHTVGQTVVPQQQGKLNPLEEFILETQNERYELVKAAREPIKGQYIVVLKPDVFTTSSSDTARMRAAEVRSMAEDLRIKGAEILNMYEHALDGYVMKTSENMSAEFVSELRQDPRVAFVEPDQKVYALAQKLPVGVDRVDGDLSSSVSGDGRGEVDADIAILDTGIDLTHPDLNVYVEKTFVPGTPSADDDNGHGTHVAGIAAAKDNSIGVVGIAPGARLWSIKVLDSSGAGSISDIIAGIDYITAHASEIDVVNLSFGCECSSPALDAAVNNAVNAGVVFVVAAGNDHKDASSFSPARNPNVIAVSAMADSDGKCGGQGSSTKYGNDDTFASFSNYGEPVDIVAPGVGILSTYDDGKYAQLSGTSMAAPHVTGSIALYASSHPGATPAQIKAALDDSGIKPSSSCSGEGQGYFTGAPNETTKPLLNAKGL
jgi:subtilisin